MGKRSVKENKNIYQRCREENNLTRDQAAEKLVYISADRIEKIESEKSLPHPEEVLTMEECYKKPGLWNYYCTHECPIGMSHVSPVEKKELSQITLEMLAALNTLYEEKNRLIEITVDGKITEDEKKDFEAIRRKLEDISDAVNSLKLWVESSMNQ